MSKYLRIIPALGAVLFAVIGLAACGGISSDSVVKIEGNEISKTAFEHWMRVAAASTAVESGGTSKVVIPEPPNYTACIAHLAATTPKTKGTKPPTTATLKKECEQQYKALQTEVLGFLISSQWVINEAGHLGVKVSDKEVKKEFEKIKNTQFQHASEFEKFLQTSGQSVSDLLLRVKLNLLSQKIQKKVLGEKHTVTKADVEKYYNENKSRYGTPEKRAVRIILTKTEAEAQAAKKEIESGKSFASVAKAKSTDPTSKANGGLLPEVVKGEEEQALNTAIFSASTKTLGGPVKTSFGYYIYEVISITPGNQKPLKSVEAQVKSQLQTTGQQTALSKFVKEFKKHWLSKTECRVGYVVADCKTYKAPKTSATGTGTGTGTGAPATETSE